MPKFTDVLFWPASGWPERPWLEDPDADAFVKTARRVCDLYRQKIAELGLSGNAGEFRLSVGSASADADVHVCVNMDFIQTYESATVRLPPGIAQLTGGERARIVLEVVHAAVSELGPGRGWPVAALRAAYDHVEQNDFRFRWASPWKNSPNRKHRVRARYQLADDGYGRTWLEVRGSDDRESLVTPESLAFSTYEGFVRSSRTVRWQDSGAISYAPFVGLFSVGVDDVEVFRLSDLVAVGKDPEPPAEPVPCEPAAAIVVEQYKNIPDQHEIRVIGGGPMNGVPGAYSRMLDALLDAVASDFGEWWSDAEQTLLEIWFDFEPRKQGPWVRKAKDKIIARINRQVATMRASEDPAQLARSDVIELLTLVAARAGLGELPELRPGSRRRSSNPA